MSPREEVKHQYPGIYKAYEKIIEEQFDLFCKKHLDYGISNISAGTQLKNQSEISFSLTGLWYRISDKINRWKNLLVTTKKVNNEPLKDTFQDIVNYGIIAQIVEMGEWKE
jgi:hypothetical protein